MRCSDETRLLLERGARRLALANKHEARAVVLAERGDRDSMAEAADLFIVADALRGRARFIP